MEAGQAAEQEYMAVVKPGTVAILVTPQDGTEQVTFISQTAVRVTEHRAPEGYVLALGDVPYFPPGTPDMLIPMDGLLDVEEHVDELCQANRSM